MGLKWTEKEIIELEKLCEFLSIPEIALRMHRSISSINYKIKDLGLVTQNKLSLEERVKSDIGSLSESKETKITEKKYTHALKEIKRLKAEKEAIIEIVKTPQRLIITPRSDSMHEATAFIIASDWHSEELVEPGSVNGLNAFNLEEQEKRFRQFFPNSLKLLQITQKESLITQVVIGFLGDFISGSIHEELMENNQLSPIPALLLVQTQLMNGVQFLLDNSACDFLIVCHPGNHSRITPKRRISTEIGNSLEIYMYHNLAHHFRNEPRIKFMIAEGYHTYINVYDFIVRLHHGHEIRYNGGVGGIFIPVNKAIAQWNKGRRADLDVFGHFHQFKDGGNFICNGSLIGYNPFAIAIKADYEDPKQSFFLIDKKMGKSIVAPIWLTS